MPPNGILFEQKETGWKSWIANPISQWDFYLCCKALMAHRLANPDVVKTYGLSTNWDTIVQEVDETNALRILGMNGAESYIQQSGSPNSPKISPPWDRDKLAGAVGVVKKLSNGSKVLLEWEESGLPPVSTEVSENRSKICSKCPLNGKGDITRWFTVPLSELIRRQIGKLNDLNLSTKYDSLLGVCEACLCPLKLKVHAPKELIRKHTSSEMMADLHPDCWIRNETASE